MPWTPEQKKEYQKQYHEKNKGYQKDYGEKNRDKIKIRKQAYNQTPKGKKIGRICNWKRYGIITDDYDELYNHYLKTAYCDICRVELTCDTVRTVTTKVVDHDHSITDAPNFRNILCHACNCKRA